MWEWEPDHKGTVTGIVIGAFGFGSFIFSLLAIYTCNPENAPANVIGAGGIKLFDEEIASRVPIFFRRMAVVVAVLGLTAVAFVRRNPNMKKDAKLSEQEY